MHCRVVVEAAVPVFDVETEDEAIRIAISKTGEMLNPDLNYVEINMGERTSPGGEELPPAFIAADEALVALELEMTVFNVEREEHASRIARKEIGQRLENIPLEVLSVEVLEDDEDEDEDDDDDSDTDNDSDNETSTDESARDDEDEARSGDEADDQSSESDDDVLPEFEDLLE
ncbi:DUF555 domain-containing protein [Saliphagus sp. GCM10025317]